jgi:hypothetical protein
MFKQFRHLDQRMKDLREVERFFTRTQINEYRSALEQRRESKRKRHVSLLINRAKRKIGDAPASREQASLVRQMICVRDFYSRNLLYYATDFST